MIRYRSSMGLMRGVLFVLCSLLATTLLISCSDDTTDPAIEIADTHHMKPNANQLILDEDIGTDQDRSSSIWELLERPGGGHYFRGYHRSHWVMGSLSASNSIDWSRRTYYPTSGMGMTPDDIPGLSGLIYLTGSRDSDNDGRYDTGVVSVVDQSGSLLDELTWEDPTDQLRFDEIIFDGVDSGALRFLVVGAMSGSDNVYHPMVATISLFADSMLHKGERHDYTAVSNARFGEVMHNPAPSKDGYIATGGNYRANGDRDHSMVFLLDESMQIEWQQDIDTGAGLTNNISFGYHDAATADTVYCVGQTQVERTAASGAHWRGGAIVSLSPLGEIYWVRTYDISAWVDEFNDCQLKHGILYASGVFASYAKTGRQFGYGWLAKIHPLNGNVISNHYFGDNHWTSEANCMSVSDQSVVVGGYTKYQEYGAGYSHWLVDLDASGRSKDDGVSSLNEGASGPNRGKDDTRVPPRRDRDQREW
ncbi:MAG: hypothetical protein KAT30_09570 [Candidatus Krumholzibacteria bacterium]|nr:hypothetical protein [Candidatus Krumholzibacteria bacterium]